MNLSVTDQTDRGCGWCWHVSVDAPLDYVEIARGGGEATAEDAQRAGEVWTRNFCERTLAALSQKEPPIDGLRQHD